MLKPSGERVYWAVYRGSSRVKWGYASDFEEGRAKISAWKETRNDEF